MLPSIESGQAVLPDVLEFGMNGGGLRGREVLLVFQLGEALGHGDTAEIGDQAAQAVGAGADLWDIALLDGGADLVHLLGNVLNDLGEKPEVVGDADDGESLELVIVE